MLLRKAKEMDDGNPMKLPIYLTLVRAFVLRKSSDLLQVTQDQLQSEIDALEEQAARASRELAEKRAEAARVSSELLEACQNEEDLIAKFEEQTRESFDRAEPLIAVAAAARGRSDAA